MNPDIWNDDGTPRLPEMPNELIDQHPFADLAMDHRETQEPGTYEVGIESNAVFMAKLARKAKARATPGVGDVVHWWDGQRCVAAIVVETAMFEGESDVLTTFPPDGGFMAQGVGQHDEDKAVSTWHWPESL